MRIGLTSVVALLLVLPHSQALSQDPPYEYKAIGKGSLTAKATENLSSDKERREHKSDFGYHAKVDFSTEFDAKTVDGDGGKVVEVYCKLRWHAVEVNAKHEVRDRTTITRR